MKIETDRTAIEREAPNWHKLAGILEQRLTDQRWLCGENVTLADIAVAAPMHLHPYQRLPLEMYPNLRRWMTEESSGFHAGRKRMSRRRWVSSSLRA